MPSAQPSLLRSLDPAALAQSLLPFGQSRMLPRAAYTDPAVFDWEQQHFFGGGWLCVGRSEQVANPGDQRAERTGTGSVLLTRDDDGVLHAFANTCRHRGHELLPCGASASQGVIICPYHAWTYGLDGDLKAAAGFKNRPGFDAGQWGLVELPVAEWHGLIFVDGSGQAATAGRRAGHARRAGRAVRDEQAGDGRDARVRLGGQLEDPDRELPRVLPLPVDPPGAVQGQPA